MRWKPFCIDLIPIREHQLIQLVTASSRRQTVFRCSAWSKKRTCGTMLPSRGHARVRKSNCFFLKVLPQTKEADHEYRLLQKMPRRYRGSLGGVAGSTTTLSPPKKEQEISRENSDNHSIRGVVYFRHVPLPSHGESTVHQLHNFINTEHAIASARRRDGGLDDNRRELWSRSRLPVQAGNHKCWSQIPDGTRLQSY